QPPSQQLRREPGVPLALYHKSRTLGKEKEGVTALSPCSHERLSYPLHLYTEENLISKENIMADPARAARLADRIKVIVAQALERRIKDPRLGFITVTDA